MLEFMDTRERHVYVGIIDDRGALEIVDVQSFDFEVEGPPSQFAEFVVEVAIQRPGIDRQDLRIDCPAHVEIVAAGDHFDFRVPQHLVEDRGITRGRQPFVQVAEVEVVEAEADRQARDDLSGQGSGAGLPLLGGVALDEGLVERAANLPNRLLLEIPRRLDVFGGGLLRDEGAGAGRIEIGPEKLIDRHQIDGDRIGLAAVPRKHAVPVIVERRKLRDEFPDRLVRGAEKVGPVLVILDAGLVIEFRAGIAADMAAAIEHEHRQV